MRLLTPPGVFAPRNDSRMLASLVTSWAAPGMRVLDPFTGSGILAIAAAVAGAEATAIDVSRRAVACARLNARLNGTRIRALRGDMFAPVAQEEFDLIVANPPYLPALDGAEARGAARAWDAGLDGRELLDRFCREAGVHLAAGGSVLLVHSSICGAATTIGTFAAAGLDCEVVERRRGPLGPLLMARAAVLEERGLLEPGEREEEIILLRAWRVAASVSGAAAGRSAR